MKHRHPHHLIDRLEQALLFELRVANREITALLEELRLYCHRIAAPGAPSLSLTLTQGDDMTQAVLVAALPTLRIDNTTPIAPNEIASITFQKASLAGSPPVLGDPVVLQTNKAADASVGLTTADLTFTDTAVTPGDTYTAFVVDTDGHIGPLSTASVAPAIKPAPGAPSLSVTFS